MKIRIKSREELEKLFKSEPRYYLDIDGDWAYRKNNDSGQYCISQRCFSKEMFNHCGGKLIAFEYGRLGEYHYRTKEDGFPKWAWHKDWVNLVGEFHMQEFDI